MATKSTKRKSGAKKPVKTVKKKPANAAKQKPAEVRPAKAQTAGLSRRQIRIPKRRFYKRTDKRFRQRPKLIGSFKLTKKSMRLLRDHWKIIGGITIVYGLLYLVLVRGISGGLSVSDLKQQTDMLVSGAAGQITAAFSILGLLVSSPNNVASAESSSYQTFLIVITSLAIIWSFRQLLAGNKIRVRDSFYLGMQPLIPVILVIVVVSIQLLPALIGIWLFSKLDAGGIARGWWEQIGTLLLSFWFVAWSIYMLCSSVFALYIATIPGMTPMRALRSARELVRYRRWPIIRKLLFLPFTLIIAYTIIMMPFILFLPVVAQWVFLLMTSLLLAVVHAYMYTLYRELISD